MGRLCSLLDPILYYHFFSYVFESYVPSTHQQFFGKPLHSYLSPGLADAKTLSMFPPTRIVVGEMDPLVGKSWDRETYYFIDHDCNELAFR